MVNEIFNRPQAGAQQVVKEHGRVRVSWKCTQWRGKKIIIITKCSQGGWLLLSRCLRPVVILAISFMDYVIACSVKEIST